MVTKDNLNDTLADAVMDRPREFFIKNRRFCIWNPSLGMSLMIARHIENLEIDNELFAINPNMEALRLAALKKEKVCYIIAIHTFRSYFELCNSVTISRRAKYFDKHCDNDDLAELLMVILNMPKVETLISLSGIEEQQKQQAKIAKIKNADSSTLSFGGLTIYGSLIAPACEKLNLTPQEVVWNISLINLRMLLADSINSLYLSEDERKKAGNIFKSPKSDVYGMTPDDIAKLKAMDWS